MQPGGGYRVCERWAVESNAVSNWARYCTNRARLFCVAGILSCAVQSKEEAGSNAALMRTTESVPEQLNSAGLGGCITWHKQ